jgi:hypothetical protein
MAGFKKPGAALPIHKGIASVDSLEGGLGNMRAPSPDGGESNLRCRLCSNGAIYPVRCPEDEGVQGESSKRILLCVEFKSMVGVWLCY